MNNFEKINQIKSILDYCYSTCNLEFEEKDNLIDYNKTNYIESDSD